MGQPTSIRLRCGKFHDPENAEALIKGLLNPDLKHNEISWSRPNGVDRFEGSLYRFGDWLDATVEPCSNMPGFYDANFLVTQNPPVRRNYWKNWLVWFMEMILQVCKYCQIVRPPNLIRSSSVSLIDF